MSSPEYGGVYLQGKKKGRVRRNHYVLRLVSGLKKCEKITKNAEFNGDFRI